MFRAKDFLIRGESSVACKLAQRIEAEPERLRKEFLAIAIDAQQPPRVRERALFILYSWAKELGAIGSVEVAEAIVGAFPVEFPDSKLANIRQSIQGSACDLDGVSLYVFALALEVLAPGAGQANINRVLEVFKGSFFEQRLRTDLQAIREKRDEGGSRRNL
jgi:hypothetical protein